MVEELLISTVDRRADGTTALGVCRRLAYPDGTRGWDKSITPAYCPTESWNEPWAPGTEVEVDARDKTSKSGNPYLSLYPTAALANASASPNAPFQLFVEARFAQLEGHIKKLTERVEQALGDALPPF